MSKPINKNAVIYVAGHRGLVGRAILATLKDKGYTNIITRTHKELDLTNQVDTGNFFKEAQPEYVFLAAAKVGGIVANNTFRGDFIYENLMIQNNVIHHSYLNKVKKLLFLGSTCIYPKNSPQPIQEDYLLTDTLEYTNEPYAIAKIAGIKLCESYNIQFGTNFISVMPTNLYGVHDNFDLQKSHVLPALLRKIHLGRALEEDNWQAITKDLNTLPIDKVTGMSNRSDITKALKSQGIHRQDDGKVTITIWGTGKPLREFLWSEDMAEACVFLMEHVDFKDLVTKDKEIRNTHLNIGSGVEISIADLAKKITSIVGFKGKFHYDKTKPDGTLRKLTDVSKIEDLGWKHTYSLDRGIKELYHWYKNDYLSKS